MEQIGSSVCIEDSAFYSSGLERKSNPARVEMVKKWAWGFPK